MPDWSHQTRAHEAVWQAVAEGARRIVVTSPTGGGKSRMQGMDVRRIRELGKPAAIYTDRRLLVDNAGKRFDELDIQYGHVVSGYEAATLKEVQIASFQTVIARGEESIPPGYPLIDEIHNQTAPARVKIIDKHLADDPEAVMIGYTATPIDLGPYKLDRLIIAGTNTELRACGAHVLADHYGCDEPDTKRLGKRKADGDFSDANVSAAMMAGETIFGDVLHHFRTINPEAKPTILFAPGVPESRWFARIFREAGYVAAHIDGETPDDERRAIIEASRTGRCHVVCNRFVLREGVDMPWLAHCIFATAFGALKTYIQAGGRVIRAYPGLDRVTVQDHGGHWWRFCSLNDDQEWTLGDTNKTALARLHKAYVSGEKGQPINCPKCGIIRRGGGRCPKCGFEHIKSVRSVRQLDGSLKKHYGPALKIRKQEDQEQKAWTSVLIACARSGRTLRQAAGMFKARTGISVPYTVKPQPPPHYGEAALDWGQRVGDHWPWLKNMGRTAKARRASEGRACGD